jgi:hypothetical protein
MLAQVKGEITGSSGCSVFNGRAQQPRFPLVFTIGFNVISVTPTLHRRWIFPPAGWISVNSLSIHIGPKPARGGNFANAEGVLNGCPHRS